MLAELGYTAMDMNGGGKQANLPKDAETYTGAENPMVPHLLKETL